MNVEFNAKYLNLQGHEKDSYSSSEEAFFNDELDKEMHVDGGLEKYFGEGRCF